MFPTLDTAATSPYDKERNVARRIQSLTKAQRDRFPEFVDKWTQIGLCTDPADRPRAEAGIRKAYEIAGMEPPKRIVWCGSPLSQGLTRAIVFGLKNAKVGTGDGVWDNVWNSVRDRVKDNVRANVGANVWSNIGANAGGGVWNDVRANVWDSVGANVRVNVWDNIGADVWDSVGANVRDRVRDNIGADVWDSVGANVRDNAGANVRANVWDSVGANVGANVWDSVGANVWDSVGANVRDNAGANVRANVRNSVRANVRNSVGDSAYGQHDANWLAFYDYFAQVCGLSEQVQKLAGLMEVSQSAGWWLPHANICWVSERHSALRRNEVGRLHGDDGPAVEYPDGWRIWALDGIRVDEQIVMRPGEQTLKQIDGESNADLRSIRISRFGWPRYLRESGAECLDTRDNELEGTIEALYATKSGERRLVATCPTGRTFAMGVSPEVGTCEAAQKWLSPRPIRVLART